ncbi:hypothetical protein [Enterococcus sp. DIV0448]|uniref:hypothetical protein n=1 Tax=unclassified Enterococcus TaxID=2608891 RepID=UPI003F688A5C
MLIFKIWEKLKLVLFKDKNIAILSPESGEEIQLPIKVTNKKNNLFEIPELKYASKSLKIGDFFGLARKDKQYFTYQINTLLVSVGNTFLELI